MIPTPWITIVVRYGESDKHLYWDHEAIAPAFHKTEAEAREWADGYCRRNQEDLVLVAEAKAVAEADVGVNFAAVALPSEQLGGGE